MVGADAPFQSTTNVTSYHRDVRQKRDLVPGLTHPLSLDVLQRALRKFDAVEVGVGPRERRLLRLVLDPEEVP